MKKREIQSGKNGSTNQRLDRLETKIDQMLDRFATKDDLKRFATKDDLKKTESRLESKMVSKEHFDQAVKLLVTKNEFDDFKGYVIEHVSTKDDYSRYMTMLDPVVLEFRNAERVNKLTGKQLCEMDDNIAGFDKRLKWLEKGRILENGTRG